MNIQEDYVSFEIAKLLKEKGFNEKCQKVYMHNGQLLWAQIFMEGESFVNNKCINLIANYNDWITQVQGEYAYLCPTLQMAMKWLREVHNIHVELNPICTGDSEDDLEWHYGWAVKTTIFTDRWKRHNAEHISYEEACEAAIKYCLEKLI